MPKYNQHPRTIQMYYRCSPEHRSQIIECQVKLNGENRWQQVSAADILEKAVNMLHESLMKPVPVVKKAAKKKVIKKAKTKSK